MEQPTAQDVVVEDNDPSIAYKGAWKAATDPTLYTGSSYHNTEEVGAWLAFPFTGSYIFYFSDKNFDHGAFGVSLDNGPQMVFSSFSSVLLKQVVLFSQQVSAGPHVINITNLEAHFTGLDQFAYRPLSPDSTPGTSDIVSRSTAGGGHSPTPTPTPAPAVSDPGAVVGSQLPIGAYVGIGLGAAAVIILLAAAGILLWQRRQRREQNLAAQSWYLDGQHPAPQQPQPQWTMTSSPLDATGSYARSANPPSYFHSSSHVESHRSS